MSRRCTLPYFAGFFLDVVVLPAGLAGLRTLDDLEPAVGETFVAADDFAKKEWIVRQFSAPLTMASLFCLAFEAASRSRSYLCHAKRAVNGSSLKSLSRACFAAMRRRSFSTICQSARRLMYCEYTIGRCFFMISREMAWT